MKNATYFQCILLNNKGLSIIKLPISKIIIIFMNLFKNILTSILTQSYILIKNGWFFLYDIKIMEDIEWFDF